MAKKLSLSKRIKNFISNGEFSKKTQMRLILNATPCQLCCRYDDQTDFYPIVTPGKTGIRSKTYLVAQGIISKKYKIWGQDNAMILCHECRDHLAEADETYDYVYLRTLLGDN
jgi:hypothetical protein